MKVDRVQLIEQKIIQATASEHADDVFEALKWMFSIWMATVCTECRHRIVEKLKCDLPTILDRANELAASHPERCRARLYG